MTTLVYIAGPMTGYPQFNHAAFFAMEQLLRQRGLGAINPATLNPQSRPWWQCLLVCLWHVRLADGMVLLPNWERSRGARLELLLALLLGLPIVLAPTMDEVPMPSVVH